MNSKTNGMKNKDIHMKYNPNQIYNISNSPVNQSSYIHHQKQYSDYQVISPSQNKNEKIIHRSIKRNFDREGNAIITTKIVREIDYNDDKNNFNSNSIMNIRPKAINNSFQINNEHDNEILRYSNYSNNQEQDNASGMYNNNNYRYNMVSPNSYESHENNYTKIYSSSGMESDGGRDFYSAYRGSGMGKVVNLKQSEISPVIPNYTSGSDYDDTNPNPRRINMKNAGKYKYNPNNNMNYSQRLDVNKVKYKRYNLESPYTQNNDFDSPDRNYDYNISHFRNIPIEKIKGITPIYQEKVRVGTSNEFERGSYLNRSNNNHNNYQIYDILNEKATQIQSFVRGFLVRKKVLRYITLAIYYQSFCDKIQDLLCWHVRAKVFQIFKNKLLKNNKNQSLNNKRGSKENPVYPNKRKDKIDNNVSNTNTSNQSYSYIKKEKKETYTNNNRRGGNNISLNDNDNDNDDDNNNNSNNYDIYKTTKITTQKYNNNNNDYEMPGSRTIKREYSENVLMNRKNFTNRLNRPNYNICKKNDLNYSVNQTTEYRKFDYSISPTKKVTHYYISSPCSNNKPHFRFYQEIDDKTTSSTNKYRSKLSTYRSFNNTKDYKTFKNHEKVGLYKYKYENNTSNMFQDKPDYRSGIGTRSYSRGLFKTTYSSSNQNIQKCHCLDDYRNRNLNSEYNYNIVRERKIYDIRSEKDIHTHKLIRKKEININRFNDEDIESDNYLSLNIVKIPYKKSEQREEIYSKTVETKEYEEDKAKKVEEKTDKKKRRFSKIEMKKTEKMQILPLLKAKKEEVKSQSVSTRDIFTNTPHQPNYISKTETINIASKKKKVEPKIDTQKVETEIEKRVKEIIEIEKRQIEQMEQERKDRERQERMEQEKRDKERERKDKERRDKEEMLLIEREKKITEEIQRIEREKRDIERREKEAEKQREKDEKERKEREEQDKLEKAKRLKEEQDRKERERKDKERRDKLDRERREREKKEMEELLIIEREKIIKEETERLEKEMRERERKEKEMRMKREREEKLRREKEERERLERERKKEEERLERERQLEEERKERERKEKERRDKLEREKRERERKEREEQLRLEREKRKKEEQERLERERREKERKEREEQLRLEREKRKKEEQDRLERERREKERKEREEKLKKEREDRIRKEKLEQERIEREKRLKLEQEKREQERKEKERRDKLEREKKERQKREEQLRQERERQERERKKSQEKQELIRREEYIKKVEIEKQKIIDRERLAQQEKERKEKLEKMKRDKEKEKKETQITTTKKTTITTTKYSKTTGVSKEKDKDKGTTTTQTKVVTTSYKPTITKFVKKEGGGGKYPSFGPNGEYILKKDCQKNLNEVKMKLIEEYEKRIEMEKKRGQEQLRMNQENIEKRNKKEIDRLIELHKQQDDERIREIERVKEIQRRKEIELEKLREKEMKMGLELESERKKELQKQRELEEKNRKKNYIAMKKEIEINYKKKESDEKLISQTLLQSKNMKKIRETKSEEEIEEDISRAKEILRIFILSRGDPKTIKRKYFNVWRRKARLLQLLENSKIIQEFVRGNLEMAKIKKIIRKWKELSKKLYYKTRINLLKMRKGRIKISLRKKKLYELIRITRLTTIFSRRRFIHFIILIWHIYAKNIHRKRVNMKFLYENLLKTYMSLANDIFGNNQFHNPSVQDALYEAVNTNKFITLIPDDVPLARKHYEEMKKMKSADGKFFKNNRFIKSYMKTTKVEEVETKEVNKKYMGKISENRDENNSESDENKKEAERRRKLDFLSRYRKNRSYNKDQDQKQNYSYTPGHNKTEKSYENIGDDKRDKDTKIGKNSFIYKFGKKPDNKDDKSYGVTKTEENINKYNKGQIGKSNTYQNTYQYNNIINRKKSDDKDRSSYTSDNMSKKQFNIKSLDNKNDKKEGKYSTKYGNNVNVIYSSNLQPSATSNSSTIKTEKYQGTSQAQSKYQYQKKPEKEAKPSAYDTYKKNIYIKTETEEPKLYSKKIEIKPSTTTPVNTTSNNFVYISNKDKDKESDTKYKYGSVDKKYDTNKDKQLHKSNTDSKMNFVYKSKHFGSAEKKGNVGDDKKTETKIEKKYELKPYNSSSNTLNTTKKVVTTKQYKSSRYNQ